jgi:hypothetical protein
MESNNLTTRTYTTPTCTLIVANQEQQSAPFKGQARNNNPVDFIIHLEDPDLAEDAVTLQGKPQQLDHLQQIVSKYVAELVAKFPLPANALMTSAPDPEPQSDPVPPVTPDVDSPRSGLVKNLPGLRADSTRTSPPVNTDNTRSVPPQSLLAKLFGRWNQPQPERTSRPNPQGDLSAPNPATTIAPTTPYLTGVGDRALDHQLHLGNLATVVSGEVLTLSAIQLFDLASVLEEYAAQAIPTAKSPQTSTVSHDRISEHNRTKDVFATATSLSRLPNLPKIPAASAPSEHSPIYARTRRSRSSFMSAIPWAMASAIAVGVPLLLLDPKPNSFKDFTSKVTMPDLEGSKKSDTAKLPSQQSPKSGSNITAGVPTVASPTPWQAQPVQPPSVNKSLDSGSQTTNKIGVAPLPEAIVGRSGQNLSTTGSLDGKVATSVPNPLLPSDVNKLDTSTTAATKLTSTASVKSAREAALTARTKPSAAPTKPTTTIGQLPIEDPNPPGKLSVSSQPMLTPPTNLNRAISNNPQAPLMPSPSMSGGIDPVEPKPQSPKKTAQPKVKPTNASKPQPNPSASASQQPDFEPFTPVPRNPNLIDPEQNNNPQNSEPQPQPIVPNQPLPSNAQSNAADPANNPSLQETKRYFQGKWKADNSLPTSLQYVLQVSGKSGIVRSVEPQGEAATSYLQQSKFIKPGQKLISPAAVGSSDQRIRVLLQPDGNVDTFIEP